MRRLAIGLAAAAFTLGTGVPSVVPLPARGDALAGQEDPRLGPLFERLRTTTDRREAAAIEERIWQLWMTSKQEDLNILMRQGTRAMAARDFETALTTFDALVTLDPNMAEAWNKRATTYFMMGQYEASLGDVQRTLALEPRHFGAAAGLGMIYEALGEEERALKAYQEALKLNPHMHTVREKIETLERRLRERRV